MTREGKTILFTSAAVAALLLIFKPMLSNLTLNILKSFFPSWEGFSSVPYWDHKQWSWGYGTRVPGSSTNPAVKPGGTISREKAMQDAVNHIENDYSYLKTLVKVPLNAKQWAAFLSFSYNLGTGNADNLISNINAKNWAALEVQWKKYIYASGEVNSDLIARRNAEWNLFTS